MRRASGTPELLDGPLEAGDELEGNLRDLTRVNRWLWGTALSRRAVESLVSSSASGRLEIVDVGTGAADIPRGLAAGFGPRLATSVVGVDTRPEIIDVARRLDRGSDPPIELRLADGRALPFADEVFDVAHASLVVHHLEPDDVVALLREMRRVARIGVVVNDLVRAWHALLGARLLAAVATRNRLTRHDAPLSVRRAYTEPELRGIFRQAGLDVAFVARDPLRHRIALAGVPAG